MGEEEKQSPHASATGMVFACIACRSRFPRSTRCPRCLAALVYDLRIPEDRAQVVLSLERVGILTGPTRRMLVIVGAGVAVMAPSASWAAWTAGVIAVNYSCRPAKVIVGDHGRLESSFSASS